MMTRVLAAFAFCLCLVLPAGESRAQTTLDDLVRVAVLDGGLTKRSTYMAALDLTLSDGWKTYWRAPGDAGIPPTFDWSRADNVAAVNYVWPTPHVFDQGGVQSIGYKSRLVLPVEITPKDPSRPVILRGTIDIGLCKDVCIPGTLLVNHSLDADATRNPTIAAALADRPYTRAEAGVVSATCHLSPINDGMRIEARITMPTAGGTEVAVIEPGSALVWASQTEAWRDGDVLMAASELVPVRSGPFALDRSAVRITVLGAHHSVDIVGCTPG
jgi:DsbC/DsbD-like thiol-disulfide interchange protein